MSRADLPPLPPLWRWLWWSVVGRCLRCGAPRYELVETTRCETCFRTEQR